MTGAAFASACEIHNDRMFGERSRVTLRTSAPQGRTILYIIPFSASRVKDINIVIAYGRVLVGLTSTKVPGLYYL